MTVERPWALTLVQYEDAILDDYLRRNGPLACSRAEYRRLYPRGCRLQEWLWELDRAAGRGEPFASRTLDDVFTRVARVGWYLLSILNHRGGVPAGYLPPPTRRAQRIAHLALLETRRRGRAAAQEVA